MVDNNKYKDKLEVGMEFKNYKLMCAYLGEPVKKGGRNRELQGEDWKQYFTWNSEGQKRTITKVYKMDYSLIDTSNRRNNIFKDSISLIILNVLLKSESNPYIRTRRRLVTGVGLTNSSFHMYQSDSKMRAKYAQNGNHLYFSVDDYFKKVNDNNRNRLNTSLDYLYKKDFLTWKNSYILITTDDENINAYRPTTEAEELRIRDLRRDLLTQMNYDDLAHVFRKGEQKEFYQYLNPIINNEFDVNGCYPVVSMAFNAQLIQDYLEPRGLILSDEQLNFEKRKLNELTVDRIIKLAKKNNNDLEDNDENSMFIDTIETRTDEHKMVKRFGKPLFRALPDYLSTAIELSDITIKIKDFATDVAKNMDDWTTDIVVSCPLDDIPE